jgi:UDP-N-acetylglucosamine transferase subunit ALG13
LILVTVGTQGPFDRLVRAVDRWAASSGRSDVLAQIGTQAWRPAHIRWTELLEPAAFREAFEGAELIVSHAGIATLVSALELGKTIVVMPRLARLREHRNDHQVATAEHFCRKHHVRVAASEAEIASTLDESLRMVSRELIPARRTRLAPSGSLLRSVRDFIESGP